MIDLSSSAPSIGSIGSIVADAYNDRSKGFLPVVARTSDELAGTLEEAADRSTFGTRLNVRLFGGHPQDGVRLIDQSPVLWRGEIPLQLEALVPVRNHPVVASILCFGANHPSRLPSDDVLRLEDELLGRVASLPRKAPREDLRVEILPRHPSERDVADILEIYLDRYTTYLAPFTAESVRQMVAGSQVVVVRDKDGRIASICVSENARIPVPGSQSVHFVEISDAATRLDCEGSGMYTAAKAESIRFIRLANPDAVITTEARANSFGVLRSNWSLGMLVAGFKIAECIISSANNTDVRQDNIYGNLRVCYVP